VIEELPLPGKGPAQEKETGGDGESGPAGDAPAASEAEVRADLEEIGGKPVGQAGLETGAPAAQVEDLAAQVAELQRALVANQIAPKESISGGQQKAGAAAPTGPTAVEQAALRAELAELQGEAEAAGTAQAGLETGTPAGAPDQAGRPAEDKSLAEAGRDMGKSDRLNAPRTQDLAPESQPSVSTVESDKTTTRPTAPSGQTTGPMETRATEGIESDALTGKKIYQKAQTVEENVALAAAKKPSFITTLQGFAERAGGVELVGTEHALKEAESIRKKLTLET
jgi:hypothetical protein